MKDLVSLSNALHLLKKPKTTSKQTYLLLEICYLEQSIPGRFEKETTENVPHQSGLFPLSVSSRGQLKLMLLTTL